jgi:hypothetical protein
VDFPTGKVDANRNPFQWTHGLQATTAELVFVLDRNFYRRKSVSLGLTTAGLTAEKKKTRSIGIAITKLSMLWRAWLSETPSARPVPAVEGSRRRTTVTALTITRDEKV